jgi:DUF917 family protein
VWTIDKGALASIELGAALLGSGGGGQTTLFRMLAEGCLSEGGDVEVLTPFDAPDDGHVIHVGLVGAVTAFAEKPLGGNEFAEAFTSLATDREARYLVASYEGAGANAFAGLIVASAMGLPLLDVSGMGRALPRLDQTTYTAAGLGMAPFSLIDTAGNRIEITNGPAADAERLLRANTALMGGWAAFAGYVLSVEIVRRHGVVGSLRRAFDLGLALSERGVEGLVQSELDEPARDLGSGRIAEVEWRRRGSLDVGSLTINTGHHGHTLRVEMQAEFLMVISDGAIVAHTPEIICLLDRRSHQPIQAERVSPGLEVQVLAIPAPHEWLRDDKARLIDPTAFGYREEW